MKKVNLVINNRVASRNVVVLHSVISKTVVCMLKGCIEVFLADTRALQEILSEPYPRSVQDLSESVRER